MPYCGKCGMMSDEGSLFCGRCGALLQKKPTILNESIPLPVYNSLYIPVYKGEKQEFSLMGRKLNVSSSMDTFNYYRKEYNRIARQASEALRNEYINHVHNLDIFLQDFSTMYLFYRKPLIEISMHIFQDLEMYDISEQGFEEQHTKDFCLCGEDMQVMIDSFNKTIEANQQRKIRNYNMIPGLFFGGIGGLLVATATNVAISSIAESSIRNADVSPAQREELFHRINVDMLIERAYLDYWRVFLSMTWLLNKKGYDVWFPKEEDMNRATGLYQNMNASKIPEEKIPDFLITIIQSNPYDEDYFKYMAYKYGITQEIKKISEYFGYSVLS